MEEPEYETAVRQPFWTPKRKILAEVLVFTIAVEVLAMVFGGNRYLSAIIAVINVFGWGLGLLAWCKADSRVRGYQLHRSFPLAVVLFGQLALLYYLFRSRGFL